MSVLKPSKTSTNAVLLSNQFAYNTQDLIGSENIIPAISLSGFHEGLTTYTYNAVNQLLDKTNPNQGFTYDLAGNMTGGYTPEGYAFIATYDGESRLKTVQYTDAGAVAHKIEFVYNSSHFLSVVKKFENTVQVDELRMVRTGTLALQERDGANNLLREYTWGKDMGGGIGGLLNVWQGGQDYNPLYDGRGNVLSVVDNTQSVVASYRYDAFGRLMAKSGTLDQPYQFSTKRYFADVGLNYYGYRFYSPPLGRWMNRDPLGEAGGLNLYGFVLNNPVNFVDPYGLVDVGPTGFVGGAITGAVGGFITGGVTGGYEGGVLGSIGGAVGGAATGAISGAIGGVVTGTVGGGATGTFVGGMTGAVIGELFSPSTIDPSNRPGPVVKWYPVPDPPGVKRFPVPDPPGVKRYPVPDDPC